MSRLERRDDPLRPAEQQERVQGLGIGDRPVLRTTDRREPGVLRANPGVVQPGRDRVALDGLSVVVLQQEGPGPVQDAGRAATDRRRVPPGLHAVAAGLEAAVSYTHLRA